MVSFDVAGSEYWWYYDHEEVSQFYGSGLLYGWSGGHVTDVLFLDVTVSRTEKSN
jgi:hypothetical protein